LERCATSLFVDDARSLPPLSRRHESRAGFIGGGSIANAGTPFDIDTPSAASSQLSSKASGESIRSCEGGGNGRPNFAAVGAGGGGSAGAPGRTITDRPASGVRGTLVVESSGRDCPAPATDHPGR